MKPIMQIIPCGTYPFDVLVCVGVSHKKAKDRVKELLGDLWEQNKSAFDDFGKDSKGRAALFSNNGLFLFSRRLPSDSFYAGVLSHEIFHCATFLLSTVGIPLVKETEEAFAYQIQYLTQKIYEGLEVPEK